MGTVSDFLGGKPIVKEGEVLSDSLRLIDQDTIARKGKPSLRIAGIAGAETAHLDEATLDYSRTPGTLRGAFDTETSKQAIERYGFDTPVVTGKDVYGRDVGDLVNKEGKALGTTLLQQGMTGLEGDKIYNRSQRDYQIYGALDRAQRETQGNRTEEDVINELRNKGYNQQFSKLMGLDSSGLTLKPTAGSAAEYASGYSPGAKFSAYRGVTGMTGKELASVDIKTNTIKGFQLDDAFARGAIASWGDMNTAFGMISESLGWDDTAEERYKAAEYYSEVANEGPKLRNASLLDPRTGELMIGADEKSIIKKAGAWLDYTSVMLASSTPAMATTMAAAMAAPATYGATLTIPAAMYSGANYSGQSEDKKDMGKAVAIGVLQSALDLVGVKAGPIIGRIANGARVTTVLDDAALAVSKAQGISKEAAADLLGETMNRELGKTMQVMKGIAFKAATYADDAVFEGITEAAQEALSVVAEGGDMDTFETRRRLIEAGAAGFILGGTMQGGIDAGTSLYKAMEGSPAIDPEQLAQARSITERSDTLEQGSSKSVYQVVDALDSYNFEDATISPDTTSGLRDMAKAGKNRVGFGSTWKGQVNNLLDPFRSRGKFMNTLHSMLATNSGRTGANYENQRRINHSSYMKEKAFDAVQFSSNTSFNKRTNVSAYVAENRDALRKVADNAAKQSDFDMVGALRQAGLNPELAPMLDAIVRQESRGRQNLGGKVDLLGKTFNRKKVYQNKSKFIAELQAESGMTLEAAENSWQQVIGNEEVTDTGSVFGAQQTAMDDIAALAAGGASPTGSQLVIPKMDNWLEEDVFNNLQNITGALSSKEAKKSHIGKDGSRIAKAIESARVTGEITDQEAADVAKGLQDYLDQIDGQYNRIENKYALKAMDTVSVLAMLAALPLAAVSSIVEFGLVLMTGVNNPMAAVRIAAKTLAQEMAAIGNELATHLSGGRIPMADYEHRNLLRETGFLMESQNAAARVGMESSPQFAAIIQAFFKVNGLTSVTNAQRAIRLRMAKDAIEGYLAQSIIHKGTPKAAYANEMLQRMQISQREIDAMVYQRELDTGLAEELDPLELERYDNEVYSLLSAAGVTLESPEGQMLVGMIPVPQPKQVTFSSAQKIAAAKTRARAQMAYDNAINNFVDMAVAMPQKGNRPKFYNDPYFRLFTMFQGYTATATANLLPPLYQGLIGKHGAEGAKKSAATVAGLIAFAMLAVAIKDTLKGSMNPDDDQEEKSLYDSIRRTISSSGLIGVAERPINTLFPLYKRGDSELAKAVGSMGEIGKTAQQSPLMDFFNLAIGESPALDYADRVIGVAAGAVTDDPNLKRDTVSLLPLGALLKQRYPYQMKE